MSRKIAVMILAAALAAALPACSGVAPTAPPAPTLAPSVNEAGAMLPSEDPLAAPQITPQKTAMPSPTPSTAVPATPAPSPTTKPLSVAVHTMVVDDKYVGIHTVYPVVSGMRDRPFEKQMNAKAKADMQKRAADLQEQAKAFYKEAQARDFPFNPFSLDAVITVHTNDGVLLSMSNRFYTYTGGAHGIGGGIYTNVLNGLPARALTLPQLFTDPTKGIERINREIRAQMSKEDYFFPDSFKTVDEETWFYITKNYLVVAFPEYAIAPYAAGEPEFKLPLSSLSDILIPQVPH